MWGGLLENGCDPPLSCGSEHSEEVAVVTVLPDSQIAPPPHTDVKLASHRVFLLPKRLYYKMTSESKDLDGIPST